MLVNTHPRWDICKVAYMYGYQCSKCWNLQGKLKAMPNKRAWMHQCISYISIYIPELSCKSQRGAVDVVLFVLFHLLLSFLIKQFGFSFCTNQVHMWFSVVNFPLLGFVFFIQIFGLLILFKGPSINVNIFTSAQTIHFWGGLWKSTFLLYTLLFGLVFIIFMGFFGLSKYVDVYSFYWGGGGGA